MCFNMLAFLEKQKTRGRELLLGTSWWVRLKADEPIAPAAGFFFFFTSLRGAATHFLLAPWWKRLPETDPTNQIRAGVKVSGGDGGHVEGVPYEHGAFPPQGLQKAGWLSLFRVE